MKVFNVVGVEISGRERFGTNVIIDESHHDYDDDSKLKSEAIKIAKESVFNDSFSFHFANFKCNRITDKDKITEVVCDKIAYNKRMINSFELEVEKYMDYLNLQKH